MRSVAISLAALLLAAAAPAFASGLPKLGSVQVGPHHVALYNDSPTLVTGSNTLTVDVSALLPDSAFSLSLNGPQGQVIGVPLKRILIWDGPDGGHGGKETTHIDDHDARPAEADGHGSAPAPDAHAAPPAASGHGDAASQNSHPGQGAGQPGHGQATVNPSATSAHGHNGAAAAYQARGTVTLPSPGAWVARLAVQDPQGAAFSGDVPLEAVEGGPNQIYLGAAGSLIAGSVLFGAIQRRRRPGHTLNAK